MPCKRQAQASVPQPWLHDELPNALTATINHERSPVILTEEQQFDTWLRGSSEAAFGLIKTSDPERMQIVQSGLGKKDLLQAA